MNIKNSLQGALVATAVASMFVGGTAVAKAGKAMAKVTKCTGINECKSKGNCSGADNGCKSQNDCKGKGWVETKTAKECTDKHGTVVADAKPAAKSATKPADKPADSKM